jgi:hypothetical protein
MSVCVVADEFAGHDKGALPHVVLAIQLLLTLGIGVLFRKICGALGVKRWWVGLPIVGTYFLTGMYGSEAHLNGFLVVLCAATFLSLDRTPASSLRWTLFGCLLGLTFLARLDNLFFVESLAAIALVREGRRGGGGTLTRRAAAVGIAFGAFAVPYLADNLARYGHLVPISGALKSTFPRPGLHPGNLGLLGLLVSAGACASLGLASSRSTPEATRHLLRAFGIGILGQALYVTVFTRPNIPWSWYYVPGVLNIGIVAALIAERLPDRAFFGNRHRMLAALAVLITLLGTARAWLRYRDPEAAGINRFHIRANAPRERWQIRLALWMKQHLPAGSGVFVFDQPGALGYYSDLRVLPADGLVNDFAYQTDVVREGIGSYLRRRGVDYYFGLIPESDDSTEVEVSAPLTGKSAGSLHLASASLLVRTDAVAAARGWPKMAIWRLGGEP